MGTVEGPGLPLFSVDAGKIPTLPVKPVYVALAVAIGHPNIAVATEILLPHRHRSGAVIALLVGRQVGLGQAEYAPSLQVGFDYLTRNYPTGRVLIAMLLGTLPPRVGKP